MLTYLSSYDGQIENKLKAFIDKWLIYLNIAPVMTPSDL